MANLGVIEDHKVVSQEEWIAARKELLGKERLFTHERDKHSGAVAKVPRMSSGLRCDWKRSRVFAINRNVSAHASCTPVRGVADLSCSEECAPPSRIHIPNERNSTMKAGGLPA